MKNKTKKQLATLMAATVATSAIVAPITANAEVGGEITKSLTKEIKHEGIKVVKDKNKNESGEVTLHIKDIKKSLNGKSSYDLLGVHGDKFLSFEKELEKKFKGEVVFIVKEAKTKGYDKSVYLKDGNKEIHLKDIRIDNKFKDTTLDKTWAKEFIDDIYKLEIVNGTKNNELYSPNDSITRAQFSAMLARTIEKSPKKQSTFKDIQGHWAKDEIALLHELGIVKGVNTTTFNPNGKITRQQAATMLANYLKYYDIKATGDFSKLQAPDKNEIGKHAREAVAILYELDILHGNTKEGHFSPYSNLTRAQMAKIVWNTLHYYHQDGFTNDSKKITYAVNASLAKAISYLDGDYNGGEKDETGKENNSTSNGSTSGGSSSETNTKPTVKLKANPIDNYKKSKLEITAEDKEGLEKIIIKEKSTGKEHTLKVQGKKEIVNFDVDKNDNYIVTVVDTDKNEVTKEIAVKTIDTQGPKITVSKNKTSSTSKKENVVIKLVDDLSGVDYIKLPDTKNVSINEKSIEINHIFEKNGDIEIIAVDKAGNESSFTYRVKDLDGNKAPILNLTQKNKAWGKEEIILINAKDDGKLKELILPNKNIIKFNEQEIPEQEFKVKEKGTYQFKVTDNEGAVTIQEINIKNIDNTAPTMTFAVDDKPKAEHTNSTVVKIVATDKESGVDYIVLPNGEKVIAKNDALTLYETELTGKQVFKVVDKAGNEGKYTYDIPKKSSSTNQAPNLELSAPKDWSKEVTITYGYSDDEKVEKIILPNGKEEIVSKELKNTYNVTENGVYTFAAIDNKGLKTVKAIEIKNVDNEKPTITFKPLDKNNVVEIIPIDKLSGVKHMILPDGTTIKGDKSITKTLKEGDTLNIEDNVGNVSTFTYTSKDKPIDKENSNTLNIISNVHYQEGPTHLSNRYYESARITYTTTNNVVSVTNPNGLTINAQDGEFKVEENGTYTFEVKTLDNKIEKHEVKVDKLSKITKFKDEQLNRLVEYAVQKELYTAPSSLHYELVLLQTKNTNTMWLEDVKKLKHLDITGYKDNGMESSPNGLKDISDIGQLESLETLNITLVPTLDNYQPLGNLKKLKRLVMDGQDKKAALDGFLDPTVKQPKNKKLDLNFVKLINLDYFELKYFDVYSLEPLKNIKELEFKFKGKDLSTGENHDFD